MRNIVPIFKKEFSTYFNSLIAYVYITVFCVTTSWLFFRTFFLYGQANMRSFFAIIPWIFLFLIPAITMSLWSDEKKLGTLELLLTQPVHDYEVILGKYLASFVFLAVVVLLTTPLAWTVKSLGNPDMGPIYGGYIGTLLLGGAYLAIGLFMSSITSSQIIAFIGGVVAIFILLLIGETMVLFSIPQWLVPVFEHLSLSTHFDNIGRGVIDSRDVIYYLSVIVFFLFLNQSSLESRKWG